MKIQTVQHNALKFILHVQKYFRLIA